MSVAPDRLAHELREIGGIIRDGALHVGQSSYRLHEGAPQYRPSPDASWRVWPPQPAAISPLDPRLWWLVLQARCGACGGPIGMLAATLALGRGGWASYCSPRCRETARKRRQRAAKSPH